jgi:hypothetical protein
MNRGNARNKSKRAAQNTIPHGMNACVFPCARKSLLYKKEDPTAGSFAASRPS